MGKSHSKQTAASNSRQSPEGECLVVHAALQQEKTDSVEGKTLEKPNDRSDEVPLRVVLPPTKAGGTARAKLLLMEDDGRRVDTDTTDNNVHTEVSINVDEFECGVSLQRSQKQEWAFTLYDFDGNGKITKEDLAQLLKSLYDAVGSSIQLPKNGTKTLKLRLTVSPNGAQTATATPECTHATPKCTHATPGCTVAPDRKDMDVPKTATKKDGRLRNESKHRKDRENSRSATRNSAECSKSPHASSPQKNSVRVGGTVHFGCCHDDKPSDLSMVDQQKLAELLQKNLERQQLRKLHRHSRRHRMEHPTPQHMSVGQRNGECRPMENVDRRNYYLDLAGIEHCQPQSLHNTTAPAAVNFNTLTTTEARIGSKLHCWMEGGQPDSGAVRPDMHPEHKHRETQSNPNSPAWLSSPKCQSTPKCQRTQSAGMRHCPGMPPQAGAVFTPPTQRHKVRAGERERTRAMQQVAEWIDHEQFTHSDGKEDGSVLRHEHHHVHEHHHHHHYHYYHPLT